MSSNNAQEMQKYLQKWNANIGKVAKEDLRRPRVAGIRAVELSLNLLNHFKELLYAVDKEFSITRSKEIRQTFQNLLELAQAYYATELQSQQKLSPAELERLATLKVKVQDHDDELFTWGWALFRHHEGHRETLEDIRKGKGFQDNCEDVIRLVELYRDEWKNIKTKSPYTEQQLATAAEEASEVLMLLKRKEVNSGKSSLLRRQAYTLWSNDYNDLKAIGRYLQRTAKNVDELFPGINSKRKHVVTKKDVSVSQ